MNITQKQRKAVEQIGVLQSSLLFVSCFVSIFAFVLCHLLSFFWCIIWLLYISMSTRLNPSFSLLYSGLFTPQLSRRKFPSLLHIPFLSEYCGLDLRQKTCEFKDIYFQINCRKSNLLSNDTNLAIFGPLRLEIWAKTQDNIWSAGNSGLIQSLFFDSLFVLRNSKTEFSALYMFCRPSSHIFKNGDERLELSCIASFTTQINQCSVLLPDSAYLVIQYLKTH